MNRWNTPELKAKHNQWEKERWARMTDEQRQAALAQRRARHHATKHLKPKKPKVYKYHKAAVPQLDLETKVYLAGLFDGESCIRIAMHNNDGRLRCTAVVKIAMTHRETMDWVGSVLERPTKEHGNSNPNARMAWSVQVGNVEGVISLLEQLLPYLRVKREVAVAVLAFCHSRRGKELLASGDRSYTADELSLYETVKELNKTGVASEPITGET